MKNNNRRQFIKNGITLAASIVAADEFVFASIGTYPGPDRAFEFDVVPLKYGYHELEPVIDRQTMQIHYERHYNNYVKTANEAIQAEGVDLKHVSELFKTISSYSSKLRNNAGGAFNHALFWTILRKPTPANRPSGKLARAINQDFGSFEKLKERFTEQALQQFGSGWAWLTWNESNLQIGTTSNQDNPLMDITDIQGEPILNLDLWEHAYYLKYQNKRIDYITNWWSIIDWDRVALYYESDHSAF